MKKTWRGLDVYPPIDDELKLVHTNQGEFTLARYIDEMWIDEHTNRLLEVVYWMPIPILPNE
jgi:hypothetical protein